MRFQKRDEPRETARLGLFCLHFIPQVLKNGNGKKEKLLRRGADLSECNDYSFMKSVELIMSGLVIDDSRKSLSPVSR